MMMAWCLCLRFSNKLVMVDELKSLCENIDSSPCAIPHSDALKVWVPALPLVLLQLCVGTLWQCTAVPG